MGAITAQHETDAQTVREQARNGGHPSPQRRCPIVMVTDEAASCGGPSGWAVLPLTPFGYGIAPDPEACWCLGHALLVAAILSGGDALDRLLADVLADEPDWCSEHPDGSCLEAGVRWRQAA